LGRREGWEPSVIGEKEEARTPRHWISSEEDRVVGAEGEEDAGGRAAGEPRRCISNGEEGPRELRPRALAELALPEKEEPSSVAPEPVGELKTRAQDQLSGFAVDAVLRVLGGCA
jgi:hypothetical protein